MRRAKFHLAATAILFCSVASPASADLLKDPYVEDNGASVSGELNIEKAGIYQFTVMDDVDANVMINGAQIIDGDSAAKSGSIALTTGDISIAIETMNGDTAPSVEMRAMGAQSATAVFTNKASAQKSLSAQTVLRAASTMAAPTPMKQAAVSSTPPVAPRQQATAGQGVQANGPRDLRNHLRDRVRDRAIEMAVLNQEIARATINGEVSDYVRVGSSMSITATPPSGMQFVRWAGDISALADPNEAQTTLTIGPTGSSVFAIYEDPSASTPPFTTPPTNPGPTVAITINGGSGGGSYPAGTQVVIRADDPLVGETFAAWTGDVAAVSDATSSVTILTVPDAPVTLSSSYRASAMSVSLFSTSTTAYSRGATISGVVNTPQGNSVTYDVIGPDGSMSASGQTASMNPQTGAFAARIFEDVLPDSGQVTVVVNGQTASNSDAIGVVNFTVSSGTDEVAQLVSRTTYGAAPSTLARARQMGFDAYLDEQLNPTSIDDTAFRALNPDDLFDFTQGHRENELRRLALAYTIYTERQLQEVMANFWENHFYTSPGKDSAQHAETVEKAAFRANAFGSFRDLLHISAKSPTMMSFLDNKDSRDGNINENYARELLELHTVSVNSSYTEEDIIEVARVLTGWRLRVTNEDRPDGVRPTHEFEFDPDRHDQGAKVISFLNTTIQGVAGDSGVQEGEQLLDLLAAHPDTASFICGKLIQLFVTDASLPDLQTRCASTFGSTNGSIRDVVELILTSDEFRNNAAYYHSKYKTPLEYISSLVRVFELTPRLGRFDSMLNSLGRELNSAGYDIYDFQAPTGLPEVGGAWVGAASVVRRTTLGVRALRGATAQVEIDRRAILDAAPANTAEGVAALICDRAMLNRCTRIEFEEMVNAVYGDDDVFDPTGNVDSAVSRALQVAAAAQSFGLQ